MESKIMYMAINWACQIKTRIVAKETDSSIWDEKGNRELKVTQYQTAFNTFEEAKTHLLKNYEKQLDSLDFQVQEAKRKIELIKSLTTNKTP